MVQLLDFPLMMSRRRRMTWLMTRAADSQTNVSVIDVDSKRLQHLMIIYTLNVAILGPLSLDG